MSGQPIQPPAYYEQSSAAPPAAGHPAAAAGAPVGGAPAQQPASGGSFFSKLKIGAAAAATAFAAAAQQGVQSAKASIADLKAPPTKVRCSGCPLEVDVPPNIWDWACVVRFYFTSSSRASRTDHSFSAHIMCSFSAHIMCSFFFLFFTHRMVIIMSVMLLCVLHARVHEPLRQLSPR